MAKSRHYKCKSCAHTWWQVYEYGASENQVFCPECDVHHGRMAPVNVKVDATGKVGKAAGVMYDMLEKDYGMTDLKDNLRQGDVAAKVSNPVSAELGKMGGNMFSGGALPSNPAAPGGMSTEALMAGAKAYTAQSNREGRNPMNMFHAAAKKGLVPDTLAIAKSKAIRHNPNAGRRP